MTRQRQTPAARTSRPFTSKLSNQLAMAFGVMVLFSLALAATGWAQLAAIQRHFDGVVDSTLPTLATLSEVNDRLQQVRSAQLQHLAAPTMPAKDSEEKSVKAAVATFSESVKGYLAREADAGSAELNGQLNTRVEAFNTSVPKFLTMSNSAAGGEIERLLEAREYLDGPGLEAYKGADQALRQLWGHHIQQAEQAKEDGRRRHAVARRLLVGVTLFSVTLSIVLAAYIARRVTRQLGGEPAEVAEIARRIADADLSQAIAVPPGAPESVMNSMQLMQQQLRQLIGETQGTAQGILSGIGEIASGTMDLSRRTEAQAGSLQASSSTIEDMSSAVRTTADNARTVNELAQQASRAAESGGAVVGQVIQVMASIEERSRRMADTLGVIQRIAAQTNILALNAAVEAARASEEGRGFGVVAAEVRSLAKRSADAAKEIATLIDDSVQTTARGVGLAELAGKAMDEIVDRVRKVDHLMTEVSAAIGEQSSGIARVNQSIVLLEQTAQQNAALVEQTTAASGSLQSQSERLVSSVSRFKLQGDASIDEAAAPAFGPQG